MPSVAIASIGHLSTLGHLHDRTICFGRLLPITTERTTVHV
jgi:hypothetical protein